MSEERPLIRCPDLCEKHKRLLIRQSKYKPEDPWRALIVVCNLALFQAVSASDDCPDDITKVSNMGCLACKKPDCFGEIVEAAKDHEFGIGKIKRLGEKWIGR